MFGGVNSLHFAGNTLPLLTLGRALKVEGNYGARPRTSLKYLIFLLAGDIFDVVQIIFAAFNIFGIFYGKRLWPSRVCTFIVESTVTSNVQSRGNYICEEGTVTIKAVTNTSFVSTRTRVRSKSWFFFFCILPIESCPPGLLGNLLSLSRVFSLSGVILWVSAWAP